MRITRVCQIRGTDLKKTGRNRALLHHHFSAVDVEVDAGDDAGHVGGEERDGVGAIGIVRDDPERDVLGDFGHDGFTGLAGGDGVLDVALDGRSPHPSHGSGVHPDAGSAEFLGEHASGSGQRALRTCVTRLGGKRLLLDHRIDEHDRAATGLGHLFCDLLCELKGSEYGHVERFTPLGEVGLVEHREGRRYVGAVHEAVDPTELGDRGVYEMLGLVGVTDVSGTNQRATLGPTLGDRVSNFLQFRFGASSQNDIGAFACKDIRQFLTESRTDSGNDRDLALEQHV